MPWSSAWESRTWNTTSLWPGRPVPGKPKPSWDTWRNWRPRNLLPPIIIYIHNFRDPEKPQCLDLPKGQGRVLKADMEELISTLRVQIPEVFESEDYSTRREALMHTITQERNAILQELDGKAGEEGFILNISPTGLMIFPGKDGKPLAEEELKALSDEEREKLRAKSTVLHTVMNDAIRKIRKMEKEYQEKEKKLDQDVALYVVGHLMEELREKYKDLPQVLAYLNDVQEDVLKNIEDLKRRPGTQGPFPFPMPEPSFTQYQVNVFVDHSETTGAPVVFENNPTYPNLFGAMERRAQFGALVTDFTLIRNGSAAPGQWRLSGPEGHGAAALVHVLRGLEALPEKRENRH